LAAFLHYLLNHGDAVFGSWSYPLFKTDLATSRDLVRKHLEECDQLGDAASNDQLRRSQVLRDSDLVKQFLSPGFESADDLNDWGSIRVTPVVYRAARGMFRFPYRRWWKVVRPPQQPLPPGMEPDITLPSEEDSKVDLRYFVGPFQYDSDGDTVCDLDEAPEVLQVPDSPNLAPARLPRFDQRFSFDRRDELKVEDDEDACASDASKERYLRVQLNNAADEKCELRAGDFVRVLEPTKYALNRFKEMKERERKRVEAPKSWYAGVHTLFVFPLTFRPASFGWHTSTRTQSMAQSASTGSASKLRRLCLGYLAISSSSSGRWSAATICWRR